MIISMIIGTASMTSAVPIGAAVRSSGTPRTASRSKRQACAARGAMRALGASAIIGGDIASLVWLIVVLYPHDDSRPAGSTSPAIGAAILADR
ncbi:MAG TPA: hypothetical protein VHW23_33445 [Kofleriaceae bacterium]|nr:hypothetical protein [Kofleriaceae bacterium]